MNQTTAEEIAVKAAKTAVKEHERQEQRAKRVKIFQNTKKLMENYNRICQSVEEGISDISELESDVDTGEFTEEEIFINSILKSKLRSIVMIAHIDKCLKLLEEEELRKNTHEKYLAFTYFYLDGMEHEMIGKALNCTDRTSRRWVTELTSILSIYLFGADAIMLD